MIHWIVGLVFMTFVPELADPHVSQEAQMTKLKHRLEKTAQLSLVPIGEIVVAAPEPLQLPVVTGQALAVSATSPELVQRIKDLETPVVDVVLTGIIRQGKDLAAILTDGKKDYVVGVGGYVSNVFKVTQIGKSNVVLVPLVGKNREPIHLHLNEAKPMGAS